MARCIDGEGILFVAEKPPLWSGDCLEPIQVRITLYVNERR
jgi:hypothetical protein